MKKKSGFEFHIEELLNYDWLWYSVDEDDDIEPVRENPKAAAEKFGVSQEFVERVDRALHEMADEFVRAIKNDLSDLADMIDRK